MQSYSNTPRVQPARSGSNCLRQSPHGARWGRYARKSSIDGRVCDSLQMFCGRDAASETAGQGSRRTRAVPARKVRENSQARIRKAPTVARRRRHGSRLSGAGLHPRPATVPESERESRGRGQVRKPRRAGCCTPSGAAPVVWLRKISRK